MKKTLLILSVSASSLLLLQGCGGGGDNNDTSVSNGGGNTSTTAPGDNGGGTTTPSGGNTGTGGSGSGGADQGSVSAPFARGDASNYILLTPLGKSWGPLSSSTQAADGAMTALNDTQLSGDYAVQNIVGDANFVIGRWVQGTVTTATGADTLTGTDGRAYHYIAYQALSTFPDGSLHCTGGNFTTPTYTGGGGSAAQIGTATGTADIVFSDGSGALTGSMTVSANNQTATVPFPTTLASPTSMPLTGQYLSPNGVGSGVRLADAGNGAYALVVQFAAVTPSGARYIGVGRLPCTSSN